MIQLQGQREFSVPVDVLWSKLTDLEFVVSAIPDVTAIKSIQPQSAELTIRPRLTFVQAELTLHIQCEAGEPNRGLQWLLTTKAIGSSSRVRAAVALDPQPPGCVLNWQATVEELGGLLKLVPSGLVRGAADKVINDILAGVEGRLGAAIV